MTMTGQRQSGVAAAYSGASDSTPCVTDPESAPAPAPRVDLRLALAHRNVLPLARLALLMLSGAMPVSAIPLYVLGWLPMTDAALFCVIPLSVLAMGLMVHRSPEAVWAARGLAAGLVAVLAYDCVRMPLVWTNIWPDFIPRLGGAITGGHGTNALVGYTWRYLGDGGGIGLSFFVLCSVIMSIRPTLVTARPILASLGYGIFVWTGLLATVELPARGQELLFRITPASFALSLLGHLIYGTVLGLYLRHHIRTASAVAGPGHRDGYGGAAVGTVGMGRPHRNSVFSMYLLGIGWPHRNAGAPHDALGRTFPVHLRRPSAAEPVDRPRGRG